MSHTTTSTRLIIAIALAASIVVAGISLTSLQQQPGYAASQAEKHEQSTIQNLRDNFDKRSSESQQHIDQENLCLRAGKCNNSNVGEQTLGNDNSVSGFSDQSKNIQAVVTPTPTSAAGQFSLGALTNKWWDWIFSLDIVRLGGNPILDKTGALCNAGIQQNGMLFLVGTGGITIPPGQPIQGDTSYQRTCTTPIRQGTQILIPLINSECSPIEFGYDQNCNHQPAASITAPPCPQTETTYASALRSEVNKFFQPNHAPTSSLKIVVDGVPLTPQRAQSPGLGHCMTIMPNNPFSVFGPPGPPPNGNPLNVAQPTTVQSIADGYWALINNLSRGQHTLEFGGVIVFPDGSSFVTTATYHLTVV